VSCSVLLLPAVLSSGARDLAVVSVAEGAGAGAGIGEVIEFVCVGTERLCINLLASEFYI
jgi:hypothetical protein